MTSASNISGACPSPTPPSRGCGACHSRHVAYVCDLPIYIKGGSLPDTIWRCADCGTYIRAADYDEIARRGHFEVASYTDPESEERLYRSRRDFFKFIIRLCERSLGRPIRGTRVLDVGCAYGHLLDLLREHGAVVVGTEIVERLRDAVRNRGHTVYASFEDVPQSSQLDAIMILDTLYNLEDPGAHLRQYRRLLNPGGRLLIRTTHRTPLFSLLRLLGQRITDAHFGDAKHGFSYAGLRILLQDSGYSIERIVLHEKGKHHQKFTTHIYYLVSLFLSALIRPPLTPGLILIAKSENSQ